MSKQIFNEFFFFKYARNVMSVVHIMQKNSLLFQDITT